MYVYLYISGCVHDLRQNHQLYSVACNLKKKNTICGSTAHDLKCFGLWDSHPERHSCRRSRLQEWGVRGEGALSGTCEPSIYLSDLGAVLLRRPEETLTSSATCGRTKKSIQVSKTRGYIKKRPPSHSPNPPLTYSSPSHCELIWKREQYEKSKILLVLKDYFNTMQLF